MVKAIGCISDKELKSLVILGVFKNADYITHIDFKKAEIEYAIIDEKKDRAILYLKGIGIVKIKNFRKYYPHYIDIMDKYLCKEGFKLILEKMGRYGYMLHLQHINRNREYKIV